MRIQIVSTLLIFSFLAPQARGLDDLDQQVEQAYIKKAASCITVPQSGAPTGFEEETRKNCETNLRAGLRAEVEQSQLANLKKQFCAPDCKPEELSRLGGAIIATFTARCQQLLPKSLHGAIHLQEIQCSQPTGDAASRRQRNADIAVACAANIAKGGAKQTQTLLSHVVSAPARIAALPSEMFGSLGKAMAKFAKDGAHDTLMSTHGQLMAAAGDLSSQTAKAVFQANRQAAAMYECLPLEKQWELACYVGGIVAATVTEGALLSRGANFAMNLESTQILISEAGKLLVEGASSPAVLARAKRLADRDSFRRAGLASAGSNPQLKIWELRAAGRNAEAAALEKALEMELTNGKFREVRFSSLGGGQGARLVRSESGTEGVWKPFSNTEYANGHAEISAYKVSERLGLDTVPVTVEHTLNGQRGTLQLRVKDLADGDRPGEGYRRKHALFDFLIGNWDRNPGNALLTKDGKSVAIDHGTGFTFNKANRFDVEKEFTQVIEPARKSSEFLESLRRRPNPAPDLQALIRKNEALHAATVAEQKKRLNGLVFSRNSYERLRATTPEQWNAELGSRLSPHQISQLRERQQRIIEMVEDARRVLGDDIFAK